MVITHSITGDENDTKKFWVFCITSFFQQVGGFWVLLFAGSASMA